MEITETDVTAKISLPISKIKRICKLDPDAGPISSEAAILIAMATENFIKILATAAYKNISLSKRKTLQAKDVETCIKNNDLFFFLDGALDGWPEWTTTKRAPTSGPAENNDMDAIDSEQSDTEANNEDEADGAEIATENAVPGVGAEELLPSTDLFPEGNVE